MHADKAQICNLVGFLGVAYEIMVKVFLAGAEETQNSFIRKSLPKDRTAHELWKP